MSVTYCHILYFKYEIQYRPDKSIYRQPRLRDSSYHQLRSIHPSKSVICVADPAFMMKLVTPLGVQSFQVALVKLGLLGKGG